MALEPSLIEYCSPTLASLKTGSLFSFVAPVWRDLHMEAEKLNRQFREKGLVLRIIRADEKRALCYLYRRSQIRKLLEASSVQEFLRGQGYTVMTEQAVLGQLFRRMSEEKKFPHEVGLFLGYPLADVIGFICHKGKDSLCCGCWKAYTDECTARKMFARFQKCTDVYRRLYRSGYPINRLTVAA